MMRSTTSRSACAPRDHGFGVLTKIDVQATMKTKIGDMLPCNVILRETDHVIEVSAVDPVASMAAIDNAGLKAIAAQVRNLLAQAVDAA